jgi:hypothetical protein
MKSKTVENTDEAYEKLAADLEKLNNILHGTNENEVAQVVVRNDPDGLAAMDENHDGALTTFETRDAVPASYEGEFSAFQLKQKPDKTDRDGKTGTIVPTSGYAAIEKSKNPVSNALNSKKFLSLTKTLKEMQDTYRENSPFNIEGFSINLTFPPGVTIDFGFRE